MKSLAEKIKDIKDDIKEVKNDAKENGVPVTKVNKALANIKKMMKEEPEKAKDLAETIIKNTYRTLMSRGMKGCYIYCTDKETEEYFRKRV